MGQADVARKLLVIDADQISRTVFKHTFAMRGHKVRLAATPAEALELVALEPPDVILYDWSFRDQSGLGLAKSLRAACKSPVAIVALSVLDEPDDFRCREDVDDYIVKPALAESIEQVFETALAIRRRL
jgi:CheY-like chemotaxis protein